MPDLLDIQFAPAVGAPAGAVAAACWRGIGARQHRRARHRRAQRRARCQEGGDGRPASPARPRAPIEILAAARHRHPAADPARHGQGAQGARPPPARRLCLRPDQRPQGRAPPRSSPTRPTPARSAPRCSPPTSRYGALLRSYTFKKYRTKKPPEDGAEGDLLATACTRLVIQCAKPDARRQGCSQMPQGAWPRACSSRATSSTSRPTSWAPSSSPSACAISRSAGLEVEVLDRGPARRAQDGRAAGGRAGQRAALARGRACSGTAPSPSAPRPLCFVGKGVCFDTGGISIEAGCAAWRT